MNNTLNDKTLEISSNLDESFWNQRWENQETGWDIGYASPAIVEYFKDFKNKNIRILIPGCGNAYEAEFLLKEGFTNITVLDIAPKAVELLQKKFENNPEIKIICEDFFEHSGNYDIIIEQTFFCAISPNLRNDYAKKANELLNEDGHIIGVLFNIVFNRPEPPFGGTEEEYQLTFNKYFNIEKLENCYNSIPPRQGNEFFIKFTKKDT